MSGPAAAGVEPSSAPIHVGADARIDRIAAAQHGVVTRSQLVEAGVALHRIDYRLRVGRLQPLHTGVYQVGPVTMVRQREMAAVLRCGVGAVLSHESAAAAWELLLVGKASSPVAVSTPRDIRVPGSGVRAHRLVRFEPDEVTYLDGIPITAPERTLLDLAGCMSAWDLERALARAERKSMLDRDVLKRLLARYAGRPGSGRLRKLLARGDAPLTRSEAEAVFLRLVRRARLPAPGANAVVDGYEVDFLWAAEKLIVEIDGFAYHSGRDAFERDRQRDGDLTAAGYRVMRVTWRQLTREREAVLARVIRALAEASISKRS